MALVFEIDMGIGILFPLLQRIRPIQDSIYQLTCI